VKKTLCTYLRPVTYPATPEVKLFAGKPGRSSFPTYSEIWNTVSSAEKVTEGDALMVWVHRKSGQAPRCRTFSGNSCRPDIPPCNAPHPGAHGARTGV
jgi:acyl-CoA thioesterase FadM